MYYVINESSSNENFLTYIWHIISNKRLDISFDKNSKFYINVKKKGWTNFFSNEKYARLPEYISEY